MKKKILELLGRAIEAAFIDGSLCRAEAPIIEIELPREENHGDYATNIAMILAKTQKKSPRLVAETIMNHLHCNGILEKVDLAGPGFINFFVKKDLWVTLLEEVDLKGDAYGRSDLGSGQRVQVEFVSANPTGPLHIGHGRGAAVGDVLSRILEATGHAVVKEYYINDAGNQMANLGKSVYFRYLELLGQSVSLPDGCYRGDYIIELARTMLDRHGAALQSTTPEEVIPLFTDYAAGIIMEGIKEDLRIFGVEFDCYFKESELHKDRGVFNLLETLRSRAFVYEQEGALWFKSTAFGDEKDRVVIRETGEPTYFAGDIAYHKNKYERGFDKVIDIWGADHHGYIPRMSAGIQALGRSRDDLKIVLVQLVNLLRNGVPVAMSTRAGEFVTLREVIDEVGADAARYNFLMRRSNSHLDFDLEIAKKQSDENPVYYVQYAHARIVNILKTAADRGYGVPRYGEINAGLLTEPEEHELVKMIDRYPELIEGCALSLEPHRITFYLNGLAALLHSYYNKHRVVSDDGELTKARLFLVYSIGVVLRSALGLLGVAAPDRM
ncbi:MAG: arginine--tRNA ligase [Deltaproteobacteria bacterium]|nr:arginine--tRNA ligase [Deltaproteobacteria bacterium]